MSDLELLSFSRQAAKHAKSEGVAHVRGEGARKSSTPPEHGSDFGPLTPDYSKSVLSRNLDIRLLPVSATYTICSAYATP